MALALLHGAITTSDISMGATSVKCGFARVALQITAGAFDQTTFCSARWVEETKGRLQGSGSIVGYSSTGAAWSDPLVWVTSATSTAAILTIATGCTLTFAANVLSDGVDLIAMATSGRSVDFRTTGSIISVWVTS